MEVLKDGREGDAFLDIDVEGVERTTENIRKLKE